MNAKESRLARDVDKSRANVAPSAERMALARDAYNEAPDSLRAATLYLRESRRYCKASRQLADAKRALWAHRNGEAGAIDWEALIIVVCALMFVALMFLGINELLDVIDSRTSPLPEGQPK